MSTELAKGYEPKDVEARWRAHWEENETFKADVDAEGEPFSIVIPPPNVTGALHMGHALNLTIQDVLCRYHRQKGRKVLWVPGMDHAGIATQNVVERKLKAEGKTRDDLGRDKFIEEVWAWKEDFGGRILNQIRMLGASVDWSRERFTMDEGLSKAVREVFVSLYEQGLIYKGEYIINWCTRCHTALADDEVEYSACKNKLYHLKYPLADGSGEIVVATVRPETMLADTAVAVHPEDDRYQDMVGKEVILPLTGRKVKIIADTYVEREFGTGCLKVTPAHDMNDWELGKKHGLEVIKIINGEGFITADAGAEYEGLSVVEAREKIIADLKAGGWLVKEEDYDNKVSECYRCHTPIEPFVSPQWFVSVKSLADRAMAAVREGDTKIYPQHWEKTYFNWLENIRDWCISRQIWWGHRIPVWTCEECGEVIVSREDPTVCSCGGALVQEEDVLDTWFSSALWPFSTMGWPEKTRDLEEFYPTSVLTTGFDILFFWVARMMMMGQQFMGEVPFKDVYIHALVRDEHGKKMSKSTGNVIDPLDMIEKYGCDSLRLTLAAFAAMGRDIKLSEARIEGYRHFVNKLWNAARFTLMNMEGCADKIADTPLESAKGLHHDWILSRLEVIKNKVDSAISGYYFNEAAQGLYGFIWHEFCDWYLEMVKPELNSDDEAVKLPALKVLWTVLTETLTLLHPIMPFVTQEVWAHLPAIPAEDLATQPFPEYRREYENAQAEEDMALLQESIVAVRNIRGELNIAPSLKLKMIVRTDSDHAMAVLQDNASQVERLARVEDMQLGTDVTAPKASASNVVRGSEVFVPLEGAVDFDAELARLDKELGKIAKEYEIVQKKLANEGFVSKAPAAVVEKEREKAAELDEKREKLNALRDRLQSVMG